MCDVEQRVMLTHTKGISCEIVTSRGVGKSLAIDALLQVCAIDYG
jgi:hypothetical protein